MSDHDMTTAPGAGPTPGEPGRLGSPGRFLEGNRAPGRRRVWRVLLFVVLALLVALNIVVPNHHPHFGVDQTPGFWPVFSFFMGIAMIFFVKKIVQPLIKRPEDHYGDL